MTASTALMTELTEPGAERALWIGRVSSAAQVSWIAGQSLGGYLNSFGDARYPSAVAVGLYAFDFALISLALPAGAAAAAEPRDAKAPAESPRGSGGPCSRRATSPRSASRGSRSPSRAARRP
ncbi:major facilitator superfamily-like protein [Aureococcus anophagefferens]|nr:major facilitator superfamily-like protein [Aureococcus anophagefferens]